MMKKLLAILHLRTDRHESERLSAYLDGQLGRGAVSVVETHLNECASCSEELRELRAVRSALGSLPQAEAPRSFRLHTWQVQAVRRDRPAVARLAPAVGALAAIALVLLVAADVSRSGGGGARQSVSTDSFARAPVMTSAPPAAADAASRSADATANGAQPAPFAPNAASPVPENKSLDSAAGGAAENGAATATLQQPEAPTVSQTPAGAFYSSNGTSTTGETSPEDRQQQPESSEDSGTSSSGVDGLRWAEVGLGIIIIVAGAVVLTRFVRGGTS